MLGKEPMYAYNRGHQTGSDDMSNNSIPNAPAVLTQSRGVYQWRVPVCPLCGGEHWHGGGKVGGQDPDDLLGHRTAHCANDGRTNGYKLVSNAPTVI